MDHLARLAFLSYSHADKATVVAVQAALETRGWQVFRDETAIEAGEPLPRVIADAIDRADLFLAHVSASYIASRPCQWELDQAITRRFGEERFRIVALRLDNNPVPAALRASLYVDVTRGAETAAVDAVLQRRQHLGPRRNPLPAGTRRNRRSLPGAVLGPLATLGLCLALVLAAIIALSGNDAEPRGGIRGPVDMDHDGVVGAPTGGDCDDGNPLIRPGSYDFAGNGVDEDCSGEDAAPVLGAEEGLTSRGRVTPTGAHTQLVRLWLDKLPKDTRITLRCRGQACAASEFELTVGRSHEKVSLLGPIRYLFGQARQEPLVVRAPASLEVVAAHPGFVAEKRTYIFRKRRISERPIECLDDERWKPCR